MASLNLSINGPSIRSSYQGVINASLPPSGSSTYGHWALFSVQAPLMNAFQDSGSKESVLKVETAGEGDLAELVEDFNEGRIQFALVKVKDPNSGLPKNVLIAWCGGGVPERTKGYFTSHLAAVSKLLHGYHVQITARSDADLAPEAIVSKVADASGAKYTAGGSAPIQPSGPPPPLAKKPVFTPTTSAPANPLVAARNQRPVNADEDGWGADAPPVTRTQLEKVQPAYTPIKVNMAELVKSRDDSRSNGSSSDGPASVIGGGYQPVGKVNIAAIRAQARSDRQDDRPTTVKGAYEPVGKVDIAAIRARAQRPADPAEDAASKISAGPSPAFPQSSERLTQLPKPRVAKKFGGASAYTGTKAPTPGGLGFGAPAASAAAPLGSASRTFADRGGKTPAQLWAEKKGLQASGGAGPAVSPPVTSPVAAQKSGSEWKSGYSGKSWAPVQTSNFSRGGVESQKTGGTELSERSEHEAAPASPAGGISAIRDRFKDAAPMGAAAPSAPRVPDYQGDEYAPPPPPLSSRPSGPSGGFALPGLPSRPPPAAEEEGDGDNEDTEEPPSPVRVAVPVPRGPEPGPEPHTERLPIRPVPGPEDLPRDHDLPGQEQTLGPRVTAMPEADLAPDHPLGPAPGGGGKRAVVQYDYDKDEDNEIDLREGEQVTGIEMVDENWWMGTNSRGESGLFPSNYVEVADDHASLAPAAPATSAPAVVVPASVPAPEPEPEQHHDVAGGHGSTATAQFDYEAAEDNELTFPEGAMITNLDFPDEEWWFGHYEGASGLFPASYVQLNA